MITAKEARKIAMEARQRQEWYARINANRVGMKCHYYQVNDNVCFEYWNKHEWEFTLCGAMEQEKAEAYISVLVSMSHYMKTINVTLSKIPVLLAQCKAQLTSIDEACSALSA